MIENILEHLLIENVYDFLIGKDKAVKDAVLQQLSQDDLMDFLHIALERSWFFTLGQPNPCNSGIAPLTTAIQGGSSMIVGSGASQGPTTTTASTVASGATVASKSFIADGYVRPSVASEVASSSISPSSGGLK